MKSSCKLKNQKGYTLVEAVIIIILLAILSFGIGNFIISSVQSWLYISGREKADGTARSAMNTILAEFRRISRPQNITIAATQECQFLDIDAFTVDFKQSGTNLLRNTEVLTTELISPEGLRFTYLDASGNETAVKPDMRSIRVKLSVLSAGQRVILESSARLRNL